MRSNWHTRHLLAHYFGMPQNASMGHEKLELAAIRANLNASRKAAGENPRETDG